MISEKNKQTFFRFGPIQQSRESFACVRYDTYILSVIHVSRNLCISPSIFCNWKYLPQVATNVEWIHFYPQFV